MYHAGSMRSVWGIATHQAAVGHSYNIQNATVHAWNERTSGSGAGSGRPDDSLVALTSPGDVAADSVGRLPRSFRKKSRSPPTYRSCVCAGSYCCIWSMIHSGAGVSGSRITCSLVGWVPTGTGLPAASCRLLLRARANTPEGFSAGCRGKGCEWACCCGC